MLARHAPTLALVASLTFLPATATAQLEILSITRAPVAPDGTTAGAPTDFVVTVVDRDPSVPGIGLSTGGTVEVVLPPSFTIMPSPRNSAVPLQGWPQSPPGPPPAGNWTTNVDTAINAITITMNVDFLPGGVFGPAFKQLHLILLDSVNPGPGRYPVQITIDTDGAGPATSMTAIGHVKIIPRTRPSINIVSLFSGPPGPPPPFFNPIYQSTQLGNPARQAGFYLWGKDSEPVVNVDLVMTNRRHGRLVNVTNNKTVGQVSIHAPAGARNFTLATMGPSMLEPTAFVTGVPVGVLITRFTPDPNVTGDYTIALQMNGGNTERLFVTVTP